MSNSERKCLYCYDRLEDKPGDFHKRCSKLFFGSDMPPQADFGSADIGKMALKVLNKSESVTGVQPKLSLEIQNTSKKEKRFTIVGLWGNYILKPPLPRYPQMPEIEDLTMHLSELLDIRTARHSLIRISSGELAYITKRFDRAGGQKLQVEDMAQLTETLTERKYKSSMEKIAAAIRKYSTNTQLDLINLFEVTLFSFITGNADMHLKNFSLLRTEDNDIVYSPAYDLLSTKLLIPQDMEELALTLNGKKSNFKRRDFDEFASRLGINTKALDNIYDKFFGRQAAMLEFTDRSFLSEATKEKYKSLITARFSRLKQVSS